VHGDNNLKSMLLFLMFFNGMKSAKWFLHHISSCDINNWSVITTDTFIPDTDVRSNLSHPCNEQHQGKIVLVFIS